MLTVIDEKVTVSEKCIERTVYLGPSEQDKKDEQAIVNAIAEHKYSAGWSEGYKAGRNAVLWAFLTVSVVAGIGWIVYIWH